jgi:O-antigen/teichoic acid export membrane protein
MWLRILPFAGWLCLTDFLDNTFVAIDRYMIIHFSGYDEQAALELVGQYHCSRILGVLLVSVAAMLATVILPYLTVDWERQRRRIVSAKLNFGIKGVGLMMLFASMAVIMVGPTIFNWILDGKYAEGFAVLPCTMAYCIWFGLVILAQPYLFCAEKAVLRASSIAVGMFVNISLNALLLPSFGLEGAVWATSIANLATLLIVLFFCRQQGMLITPGIWVVLLLPCCLLLSIVPMVLSVAACVGLAYARGWLFTRWERRQIAESIEGLRARFA